MQTQIIVPRRKTRLVSPDDCVRAMPLGIGLGLGMMGRRSGASVFTPATISGCVMWVRADLGITLNAGNVSAWADQSGAGNHATQGTGVQQPAYINDGSGQGGRALVRFTGTTLLAHALTLAAAGSTIFLVAKSTVAAYSRAISVGLGGVRIYGQMSSSAWGIYVAGDVVSTQNSTSAVKGLMVVARASNDIDLRTRSGGATVLDNVTPAGTHDGQSGAIGNEPGGTTPFGDIYEVAVYSNAISGANATLLEGYATTRYGI